MFGAEMKVAVVCLLAFAAVVYVAARPEEKYTNKFDNIDVDQILHSDRLLNNYFKCLMGEASCTPEGNELKSKYNTVRHFFIAACALRS